MSNQEREPLHVDGENQKLTKVQLKQKKHEKALQNFDL